MSPPCAEQPRSPQTRASSKYFNGVENHGTPRTLEEARLLREVDLRLAGAEKVAIAALTGDTFDVDTALWTTAQCIQKARLFLRGVAA